MSSDYSVLEIGSGPGTYTVHLSRGVRHVTATDVSCRMLDINRFNLEHEDIFNVDLVQHDWHKDPPLKHHDACIASFVPMMDTAESLEHMEHASKHTCTTIAWEVNHGEEITQSIRHGLGIGWPHPAHDNTLTCLKSMGRNAKRKTFDTRVRASLPAEEVIRREVSRFASSGFDVEDIARCVILDMCEDGMLHLDHVNRIGVTYWETDDL